LKYRQKLINTYYFNKKEQKLLDSYISKTNNSYYYLYKNDVDFTKEIGLDTNSLCVSLIKVGVSVRNIDGTLRRTNNIDWDLLDEIAEQWNEI